METTKIERSVLFKAPPFCLLKTPMQCEFINQTTGRRCRARAMVTDTMCLWHTTDPEMVKKRNIASAIGGKHLKGMSLKLSKGKVKDSRDVKKFLGEIIENIRAGNIKLTSADVKVLPQLATAFLKAEEKAMNIERLEILEKELARIKE